MMHRRDDPNTITNHWIAKIDNLGTFTAVDIAPYAAMDVAYVSAGSTTNIDVLANDHDANNNCKPRVLADRF